MPDPLDTRDDLLRIIETAISGHERTQQTALGPSEIGHPCDRWLTYRILGRKPTEIPAKSWKPTVGTAVHTWLDEALTKYGEGRYLTEQTVTAGTIGAALLRGHLDVYDLLTETVVDWKLVSPRRVRKYRREGPGPEYEVQTQTYGYAMEREGRHPKRVAVFFLPRDGDLVPDDMHWWEAPYDRSVGERMVARADRLARRAAERGVDALSIADDAQHFCRWCEFYKPRSTDLSVGCPGAGKWQQPW